MFEWLEERVAGPVEMIDWLFYQQIDLFHWQLHSIDSTRKDSAQIPLKGGNRHGGKERRLTEPDGSGGSLNIDGVCVKRGSVEPIESVFSQMYVNESENVPT